MPATPDDLFALLARLQVPCTTVSHPPVFTVQEAQALRGAIAGGHTKNLFLKDRRGAFFLVVACEDAVIDLKALPGRLGAAGRLSFGSADALMELLGVVPGSVTPFAAINDVSGKVAVVLDSAMLEHPVLNYHPLVNTMTTSITPDGLLTFLKACGHPPVIAAAAGPGAAAGAAGEP